MEKWIEEIFEIFRLINKGAEIIANGNLKEGKKVIDRALQRLREIAQQDKIGDLFKDIKDYIIRLELKRTEAIKDISHYERAFIKKYRISARSVVNHIYEFYKNYYEYIDLNEIVNIFEQDPEDFVLWLEKCADECIRNLEIAKEKPRREKKRLKIGALNKVAYISIGTSLMIGNTFHPSFKDASYSIGSAFISEDCDYYFLINNSNKPLQRTGYTPAAEFKR